MIKIINKKLVIILNRPDVGERGRKIWFYLWINFRKYSLMNCGELMKTSPESIKAGVFTGWETLRNIGNIDKNGVGDEQEIIRGKTLDELLSTLTLPNPHLLEVLVN